ncbi:uncharacterized protein LOC130447752 isoform X1 [Diorhabda sublineata]|uniref:uncharacterized protein LOC130447752 isoform X1 n=1 Tax=Diorhabda sublineata TaxID=1163346 RepID=UPI0024E10098|nr:uncharacterized protein LOC130447752 isoform X1 [Diorhabda sublineata]
MWNISRFGHGGSMMGPNFTPQKRDFSYNLTNVVIAPGKSFQNPNFVNNHYPNVHSHYNNQLSLPNHNICHTPIDIHKIAPVDIPAPETVKQKSLNENSSQNIVKTIKEKLCDSPIKQIPVENKQMCHTRKRCKKNKSHKRKEPNKNSKEHNTKRQINDMMEIDFEPDISMNSCDTNMTTLQSLTPPTTMRLKDYIVDVSSSPIKLSTSNDDTFTFISITPPTNKYIRERELSTCESEDSFIVFDSGTDEELNFSDESKDSIEFETDNDDREDEEDDSDSEIDDDFDSSNSVVPSKKVRFAENEELCEIHPMVQWSFAYRNARKGPWEEYARDRHRFNKRIQDTEEVLSSIFDPKHRENVYRERFEDRV